MSVVLAGSTRANRFFALILSAFGGLALALGGIGVFGVTAYTVGRRIPEFGVRIALGSSRARLLQSAARRTLMPVAVGLTVGLLSALATSRLLESQLYGVEPTDPVTFGAVALLLGGIAAVASSIPAYRASRIDPAVVLNGE